MHTRPRVLSLWLCALLGCGSGITAGPEASPAGTPGSYAAGMGGKGVQAGLGAMPGSGGASGSRAGAGKGAGAGGAGAVGTAGAGFGGAGGARSGGAGGVPSGEGVAGNPSTAPVDCQSDAPTEFEPNPDVGPGGSTFKDSARFRIYGSPGAGAVTATLNHLEAAYSCFVDDLCFRSTGLPARSNDGPHYKLNVYAVGRLDGAAGVQQTDSAAGIAYLEVVNDQLAVPDVTVHEYGHALAYHQYDWVDQVRTGAWWETMANWVADTYLTSDYCAPARERYGVQAGDTQISLSRVIGQSHLLIVSTQNYYEAWPFFTYLSNNPDRYPGLGRQAIPELMRNHPGNNETPLHVLERVAKPVRVQTILGRYWARMAYLDIGHPKAQQRFFDQRSRLDFNNLDAMGNDTYRVKAARRPAYGGANIIPLSGSGELSVAITNLGNGQQGSNFTATLSIRSSGGAVRYVDLPDGAATASLGNDEEATLVVVNTPDTLIQYDAFRTASSSPESAGLNYEVRLTGASPAD